MSTLAGGFGSGGSGGSGDRPSGFKAVSAKQLKNQAFDWRHCPAIDDETAPAVMPFGADLANGAIRAYDIGQGNCIGIGRYTWAFGAGGGWQGPVVFIDFGIPMFFMKYSAPGYPAGGEVMGCDTDVDSVESILITHWDWDHWAGGLYNHYRAPFSLHTEAQRAQTKNWFVPRQELGNTHLNFATALHANDRIYCLDFTTPRGVFAIQIGKFLLVAEGARIFQDIFGLDVEDIYAEPIGASYLRNNSSNGFTVIRFPNADRAAEVLQAGDFSTCVQYASEAALLPGDADYTSLPSIRQQIQNSFEADVDETPEILPYRCVIATHHGSGRNMRGSDATRRPDDYYDIPPRPCQALFFNGHCIVSSGTSATGYQCYGHPNDNAIDAYEAREWRIETTAALGGSARGPVTFTFCVFSSFDGRGYTQDDRDDIGL